MFALLKKAVPVKVKAKLMATLGVLITLLIAVPTILSYRATINNTTASIEHELTVTITQVLYILTTEKAEQMRLIAHTVAGMPSVQDNLMFQSRDDLQTVAAPLYTGLKKIMPLNVFHFHLPPAISFLRLQKPEKFGDDLSGFRKTVVQVNKTQQDAIGIEKGVAGLSIRAVVPVKYLNKKHVGSVEFGVPLNDRFFNELKG